MVPTVPIIDFQPFLSGRESEKRETCDAIIDSLKNTGFVVLLNHGIPEEMVAAMFGWSKRFFASPLEVKNLAPHPASGAHHRGFSACGQENIIQEDTDGVRDQRTLPSCKESFDCGSEDNLLMPNIWLPEDKLPGFKGACLNFSSTCHATKLTILDAIAHGLGLPSSHFAEFFTGTDDQLRLSHYPSILKRDLEDEKVARISAHSDYGGITLLFQDNVGGLEVEDPSLPGVFRPVPPIPGALVVNVGDLMMRWTNDVLRSSVHRVVAPSHEGSAQDEMTPPRYSIPYFCAPNYDTLVSALPGTFVDQEDKKYLPVKAGDYFTQRLVATY